MINATVNISLSDWKTFQEKMSALEKENSELLSSQSSVATQNLGEVEQALKNAVLAAFSIIRFAVANLSPEFVRGWPWRDLDTFGKLLIEVANLVEDQAERISLKEMGIEFQNYAYEAKAFEEHRDGRDLKKSTFNNGSTLTLVFQKNEDRLETLNRLVDMLGEIDGEQLNRFAVMYI